MKYRVVYQANSGTVELHSASCIKCDMYDTMIVDADSTWEAAMEAWADNDEPEQNAVEMTLYFPCLAPRPPARRVRLPFDPETSTDEEVIAAVMGKRIRWTNRISGRQDEARLYPDGPHYKTIRNVSVETHPHLHTSIVWVGDERVLSFISTGVEGAYRAVRLSAINYVGK